MSQQLESAMARVKASPEAFRMAVLIDTDDGPKRAAECRDDFQCEVDKIIDPACQRACGQDVDVPFQRIWLERGRGHSKTTDAALAATYMLFAAIRKIEGVAVAADKDQAGLVRNAMDTLLRLNPWLADVLEVQQWRIVNKQTGSALTVMAADVASSWGLLIDFAICDELSAWPSRAMFDSILSAIAKKRNGLLFAILNAGFRDSPICEIMEAIRNDPDWYFNRLEGPVASWITDKALAEQRRLLLPQEYSRLWLNEWANSSGVSIDPREIEACTVLKGPQQWQRDRVYVAGLDLGLKHDHSALVVLAINPLEGVVELANSMSWRPQDYGGEIDIAEVEHCVLAAHQIYNFAAVAFDPWQTAYLAQRLMAAGVPMRECPFTPGNKDLMARSLLGAFTNRLIRLYPDRDMANDLMRLRIKEGPLGFRLDSVRDDQGHSDRGIAMCTILPAALYEARNYGAGEARDEVLVA